jgi:hypothetical protein
MMGGATRASRHQRGAVAGEAGDTMEACGLERFGQGHRRQDGGQPTAQAFMAPCRTLRIEHAFTSDTNPKGYADTEHIMRTLKEEGLWLQAWASPFELVKAFAAWIATDDYHDLHAALGYRTPRKIEMEYHNSHSTPFVAA